MNNAFGSVTGRSSHPAVTPVGSEVPGVRVFPAGFWLRLAGFGVDILLVWYLVQAGGGLLNRFGWYIPREAFALALYVPLAAVGNWLYGGTPGKLLLGLRVERATQAKPPGLCQSSFRETAGKALSAAVFFLGFLRIASSPTKRGYHDWLARTRVMAVPSGAKRRRWAMALICFLALAVLTCKGAYIGWSFYMAGGPRAPLENDPGILSELKVCDIGRVTAADEPAMSAWIRQHGAPPEKFVLDLFQDHQVLLVGEVHNKRNHLVFLKNLIPRLYEEAQVRVLGLECCLASQNRALHRLVTANTFDETAALEIARNSVWHAWGYAEYWELLKSVWDLNSRLPAGSPPLRVIGLAPDLDFVSMALVKSGPFLEKLRVFRVWDDFLLTLSANGYYARQVEREVLSKNLKGVVLLGAAHSMTRVAVPSGAFLPMGAILRNTHGSAITQVRVHDDYPSSRIASLLDTAASECCGCRVAFPVTGSPFAGLRDQSQDYFGRSGTFCMGILAQAYLMLCPSKEIEQVRWIDGFITARMFARYKPFYELACGQSLVDHQMADTVFPLKGTL